MRAFSNVLKQARYLIFGLFFCHIMVLEKLRDSFVEFDFIFLNFVLVPLVIYIVLLILSPRELNFYFDVPAVLGICFLILVLIQSLILEHIQDQYLWGTYSIVFTYFILRTFKISMRYLCMAFFVGSTVCALYLISGVSLSDGNDLLRREANQAENSNYLVSIIPFALSCTLSYRKSSALAFLSFLCLCVIAYTVPLHVSRTGVVAALIGVVFVLAAQIQELYSTHALFRQKLPGILTLVVAFISIFLVTFRLYERNQTSVSGRYLIYRAAIPMLYEEPIWGLGIQRFKDVYNNYQRVYLVENELSMPERLLADDTFFAFNEFLQVGIEMGLIGFALFCGLVGFIIYCLISRYKKDDHPAINTGAAASLLAILVCCLSSYPLRTMSVLLNAVFFLAILAFNSCPAQKGVVIVQYGWPRRIGAILIILSFGYCTKKLWDRQIALFYWRKAAKLSLSVAFSDAQDYYSLAEKALADDGNFLFNYGAELHLSGRHETGLITLNSSAARISHSNLSIYQGEACLALNNIKMAEHHFKQACQMVPSRYLPKYLLFNLYKQELKFSQARAMAVDIINFPIKIPSSEINRYKNSAVEFLNSKIE